MVALAAVRALDPVGDRLDLVRVDLHAVAELGPLAELLDLEAGVADELRIEVVRQLDDREVHDDAALDLLERVALALDEDAEVVEELTL